jgi:hypothetical protein
MFWKCGTVQIFGNDDNKSKPDSGGQRPVEPLYNSDAVKSFVKLQNPIAIRQFSV